MKITSSELIEKISKLKEKPISISGYLLVDESDKKEILKLYPALDPSRYYVIQKDCIIDTFLSENDENKYVTLLLEAKCEIECVERQFIRSCDLVNKQSNIPCGCISPDEFDIVFSKKDLRRFVLRMARLLASLGLDGDFKCRAGRDSVSVPCCEAWKDLVEALDTPGEAGAAQWVEASCFATG